MNDLISRQAAISHVDDVPYIKDHPNVGLLWKAWIESLPSAQPEIKCIAKIMLTDEQVQEAFEKVKKEILAAQPERKKGKWIHGIEISREYLSGELIHIEYKDYHCSECGYTVGDIRWNVDGELVDRYCTACGAQMEVENDE